MLRRTFLLQSTAALAFQPEPKTPEGMVYVPAGPFMMGSRRGEEGDTRHEVRLSAYYIGKYLVTNANYKAFCDAEGAQFKPGGKQRSSYWDHPLFDWKTKADHPVLWVGYNQATAYCQWISEKTGWKVSLPSEAQWERAARGATKTGDEFEYPWGNTTAPDDYKTRLNFNVRCAVENGIAKGAYPHWPFVLQARANSTMASNFKAVVYGEEDSRTPDIQESSNEVKSVWKAIMDRGGHTTSVGTYPAGPEGYFDMAGNAFEWTRDFYTVSAYRSLAERSIDPCVEDPAQLTAEDRNGGSDGTRFGGRPTKIIRGGSWYANESSCQTHRRTETRAPGQGGFHSVGFRIVMTRP